MTASDYLGEVIKLMHVTQKEFCRHAGIPYQHFNEFLRGHRPLGLINCLRIEKAYGLSFMQIMTMQIEEWHEQHKDDKL